MVEIDSKLEHIVKLENRLAEIKDVDVLLESILTETRRMVNADAGSIYEVIGENNDMLKIKFGQNDTRQKLLKPGMKLPYTSFSFPISETSIAGYVAKTFKTLNIKDCYTIPETEPYKFNINPDILANYRTTSMFVVPLKSDKELYGVIQIINKKDENGNVVPFNETDELLITHFANNAINALKNAYLTQDMVRRMNMIAALRDPKETTGHVARVSRYAVEIYDRWAFNHSITEEDSHIFRDNLAIASKFHDIGKVGISDLILKKPGRFDDNERKIMKAHTCMGAKLFNPENSTMDELSYNINLHHHERWDGGPAGYPGNVDISNYETGDPAPDGQPLSGTDIPLEARIVAVADVFDALSSTRCYKEAWTIEDAFNEIEKSSGGQFDPEVVRAFLEIKDMIKAIFVDMQDAPAEQN